MYIGIKTLLMTSLCTLKPMKSIKERIDAYGKNPITCER